MADYKETTIDGTAWQRAGQIVIENTYEGLPVVQYVEESALKIGEQVYRNRVGVLQYTVDPLAVIELRDPETLELTGDSIPVALVHQALLSDYINRAEERDALMAAPVEPTPEEPIQ